MAPEKRASSLREKGDLDRRVGNVMRFIRNFGKMYDRFFSTAELSRRDASFVTSCTAKVRNNMHDLRCLVSTSCKLPGESGLSVYPVRPRILATEDTSSLEFYPYSCPYVNRIVVLSRIGDSINVYYVYSFLNLKSSSCVRVCVSVILNAQRF